MADSGEQAEGALESLEQDVAGETVGDDHVRGATEGYVAALDVADVVDAARCQDGGEVVTGPAAQGIALAGLGPDGEQADPRVLEAEPGAGIGDTGDAVLRHHGGGGVGAGAHVEQHDRVGQGGDQHGKRRTAHPAYPAQAGPGCGDGGPGGTDGHARVGLAVPYQTGGGADGRVSLAPDTAYRLVGHADDVTGGVDAHRPPDQGGRVPLRQQARGLVGGPDQRQPDGRVILGHEQCAVEHSRRSMVAAEEVDSDAHQPRSPGRWTAATRREEGSHPTIRPRGPGACCTCRRSGTRCAAAWASGSCRTRRSRVPWPSTASGAYGCWRGTSGASEPPRFCLPSRPDTLVRPLGSVLGCTGAQSSGAAVNHPTGMRTECDPAISRRPRQGRWRRPRGLPSAGRAPGGRAAAPPPRAAHRSRRTGRGSSARTAG